MDSPTASRLELGPERRATLRLPVTKVFALRSATGVDLAPARDLSLGGFGAALDNSLAPGIAVDAVLDLDEEGCLELLAVVTRAGHEAGLRFVSMLPEEYLALRAYLARRFDSIV